MDGLLATKSEDVGLIVRAVSFQDLQLSLCLYVILIRQRYRRTDRQIDRQTDRRHAITIVHRADSRSKKYK